MSGADPGFIGWEGQGHNFSSVSNMKGVGLALGFYVTGDMIQSKFA